MARLEVASETAVVALCDPSLALPSGADQDELVRALEPLARAGRVFYLVTDDPVRYRIELQAGAEPSPDLSRDFEPSGGAFGLDLPAGAAALYGWDRAGRPVVAGTIPARPGRHVLTVLGRRPFDGARYAAETAASLGAEWTYMQRVNRLGLVGCLPLGLVAATVLARRWHWLWLALPLLALTWLPFMVLKQGRRYKEAARRASEGERARPDYVITLMPAGADATAGGFLRV